MARDQIISAKLLLEPCQTLSGVVQWRIGLTARYPVDHCATAQVHLLEPCDLLRGDEVVQ